MADIVRNGPGECLTNGVYYSGNHKIVSRGPNGPRDFHSGTKKPVMPKKKVFVARNLKDCLPNLPLRPGKAKKKIKFFLSRQFCASLN